MKTELFKVYVRIYGLSENSWQGIQCVVRTLGDAEFENVIVANIREALNG